MVKQWHDEGFLVMPVAGIFTDAYAMNPRDIVPFMEASGYETIELVSSQSIAADRMKHLALFAERQPTLYPWVIEHLIDIANEPTIVGSGFHLMYIGRKP
jgi:hypothetical protein